MLGEYPRYQSSIRGDLPTRIDTEPKFGLPIKQKVTKTAFFNR